MAHPFADCRARLQRGRAQIQTLERDIASFLNRQPYRAVIDFQLEDPERPVFIKRVAIIEPPAPEWPHVVSEILANLRSALDYMVCAMTLEAGNKITNKTSYPLFEDATKLSHARESYIGGLPLAAQHMIIGWQPGRGKNQAVADGLLLLARLSNFDKHQALHVMGSIVTAANVFALNEVTGEAVPGIGTRVSEGPFEDGDELARFEPVIKPDQPTLNLHADFTFDVAFGKGGPFAGRPVVDSLHRAEYAVAFLTNQFEAWFSPGFRESGWWTT